MAYLPQQPTITDRHGTAYRVSVASNGFSVRMTVSRRNTQVGMAQCVISSPQTLTLGDITIYDRVPRRESLIVTTFRRMFRHPPRTISYRGSGLGSALLEHVKQYARQHGFERITGLAASADTPRTALFRWYRRHGFTVDAAGNMTLRLSRD